MANHSNHVEASLDVLRMSAAEIEEINRELDEKEAGFHGSNRRQDERVPYHRTSKMVVTAFHPGGTTTRYLIEPRNISRTGFGFLHGAYLHTNTQLILSMETLAHRMVNVMGRIVHCQFVRGNVHKVGVRFHQPIEMSHFILNQSSTAATDLPRLVGRVLCVDKEGAGLKMLRFILERLGLQAAASPTLDDAMQKYAAGLSFDVVLADIDGDTDAATLHASMHNADADGVIVVMTADDSPRRREELVGKLCHGVIAKPLDAQAVALALLQYLPVAPERATPETAAPAEDEPAIRSTLWDDQAMRPLILEYLDQLEKHAAELETYVEGDLDPKSLAKVLLQIKGSAGSYGYARISDSAMKLRKSAEAGDVGDAVRNQLDDLARLCRSACRAKAA